MKLSAIWSAVVLAVSALAAGCAGRGPDSAPRATAAPAAAKSAMVAHVQDVPVAGDKQLQALEARLQALGFEAEAFKDGPNGSGHSLAGKYENLEFRFSIHRERSGPDAPESISVSCETRAPSRREAEEVSSRLVSRLTAPDGGGGPSGR